MSYQPGTELKRSKYRLLGLIGQGQFGQVFCAVHRQTGRLVALKNLEHERFPTHKFLRELRFLLSFQHPNIVTCQALEHTSTGRYLVMDYCEGGTLRNLMAEESRLSLIQNLKIVADVLAGLDHAHSRGIVHCDIKPENILLHVHAGGWTARISDFGIARLSQEMVRRESNTGSPAYMAPERFYGQYSVASDLYSVGILLFELVAGFRPFSGTPAELMSAHLNAPLKMPDTIPLTWQPLIARSLQKLPARRFRSASEMLAALREIAATEFFIDLLAEDSTGPAPEREEPAASLPLFYSVVAPPECLFHPLRQDDLSEPVTALAVVSPGITPDPGTPSSNPSSNPSSLCLVYKSSKEGLSCLVDPTCSFLTADQAPVQPSHWQPTIATAELIQQLLVRPQGCFVVASRWVGLLPSAGARTDLQPIAQFTRESVIAIDPQGHWCASLSLPTETESGDLMFWPLPQQQRFALASFVPNQLSTLQLSALVIESRHAAVASPTLVALDSRHLVIVAVQSSSWAIYPQRPGERETVIKGISRRGTPLGALHLPLCLQQVMLTPTPYRLLATEADHPGTVLLIDLKPYRVKRLWVEIAPTFLAATSWGYILAEPEGRVVFVDQEGRQIGAITCPSPITAMTTMSPHGLLIATWERGQGQLYGLDLRTLGLDLVF